MPTIALYYTDAFHGAPSPHNSATKYEGVLPHLKRRRAYKTLNACGVRVAFNRQWRALKFNGAVLVSLAVCMTMLDAEKKRRVQDSERLRSGSRLQHAVTSSQIYWSSVDEPRRVYDNALCREKRGTCYFRTFSWAIQSVVDKEGIRIPMGQRHKYHTAADLRYQALETIPIFQAHSSFSLSRSARSH